MTPGYIALREGAAWLDLSGRGKILVRGEDRKRLLHAMTTNHVEQLAPGAGCYAFFLDAQGHILGDVNLFAREEFHLLDTEPETRERLFRQLERHIIADDVALEDATDSVATVSVEGPKAGDLLASLGAPVPNGLYAHAAWGSRTVARLDKARFLLFAPVLERNALVSQLEAAGAAAATAADDLVRRLEAARPRFGIDFDDHHLPQETQLLHAIHFQKGCYLGQETVERIRSRGHVNRLLARVAIEGTRLPAGVVTSAAYSPAFGKVLAYTWVRAENARPGARLVVDGLDAEVL